MASKTMASKTIDIKIGSRFNADGVLAANEGLAKLAQQVKHANDEMRQASLRGEMSVNSYAEQADKAVRAMGGGYKTLTQQLQDLAKEHQKSGEAASAAGVASTKSAVGLEMAMGLARGSVEQVSKALALMSQKIPLLGKLGIAACGAWAAAIGSVFKLLGATKDLMATVFNWGAVSDDVREASAAMLDLNNATEQFRDAMEDARKAGAAQLKAFEAEADAINKVTKAQVELNRQRDLAAAGTDDERAAINAAAESAAAEADDENAALKREARRNELLKERSRLHAEEREADKTINEAQQYFGHGNGAEDAALRAMEAKEGVRAKMAENDSALEVLDREDEAAELLTEARKQREKNAAADLAKKKLEEEKKLADEQAKKDAEVAKKAEAERLKAVETEKKAREKMEADLHAQRVANAKKEADAAKVAEDAKKGIIAAAQTEFDKAFGMYRSADHGASVIAEERGYSEDYKRLQKDATHYGGKWRIDELASLMAAGDTKGQQAKLEEWRKSSKFTPEVESMVRAAAADKTKTTAEDELRKISKNTEDLGKKLEELLAMK